VRCRVTGTMESGSICSLLEPRRLWTQIWQSVVGPSAELHTGDPAALQLSAHAPTTAQVADILTAAFEIDELVKLEKLVAETPLLSPDGRVAICGAIALAIAHRWGFGESGEPVVPTIDDVKLRVMEATAVDMDAVRGACFPESPPAMLNVARVHAVRDSAAVRVPAALPSVSPVAIVTIGSNGSGKSHVLQSLTIGELQRSHGGPSAYVDIDPDRFISELCDNDNEQRALANFCNHESFIHAIGQRRPLIFQGTGKSLETTCSRVIGRLREAGYRVFVIVVLASPADCLRRIEERRALTGRAVPSFVLLGTIKALRETIPAYIAQRRVLCERVLLYDNQRERPPTGPAFSLGAEDDAAAALALVEERLREEAV